MLGSARLCALCALCGWQFFFPEFLDEPLSWLSTLLRQIGPSKISTKDTKHCRKGHEGKPSRRQGLRASGPRSPATGQGGGGWNGSWGRSQPPPPWGCPRWVRVHSCTACARRAPWCPSWWSLLLRPADSQGGVSQGLGTAWRSWVMVWSVVAPSASLSKVSRRRCRSTSGARSTTSWGST